MAPISLLGNSFIIIPPFGNTWQQCYAYTIKHDTMWMPIQCYIHAKVGKIVSLVMLYARGWKQHMYKWYENETSAGWYQNETSTDATCCTLYLSFQMLLLTKKKPVLSQSN